MTSKLKNIQISSKHKLSALKLCISCHDMEKLIFCDFLIYKLLNGFKMTLRVRMYKNILEHFNQKLQLSRNCQLSHAHCHILFRTILFTLLPLVLRFSSDECALDESRDFEEIQCPENLSVEGFQLVSCLHSLFMSDPFIDKQGKAKPPRKGLKKTMNWLSMPQGGITPSSLRRIMNFLVRVHFCMDLHEFLKLFDHHIKFHEDPRYLQNNTCIF